MADKKPDKKTDHTTHHIDDTHVEKSWGQIFKNILTTGNQKRERNDSDMIFFENVLGVSRDYILYGDLENLSPLISYANIKQADSSVYSTKIGPALVMGGKSLWGAGIVEQFTAETFGKGLIAANMLIGRENNAKAVFGVPYSYLPAVDPFGRVFKDLFGIRPEEGTLEGDQMVTTVMTNESKFFSAYIKVGMITQAKGNSLMSKVLDATQKTLENIGKEDSGPPIVTEAFRNAMKAFNGNFDEYTKAKKMDKATIDKLRPVYDEWKKGADKTIAESKSALSTIVTSFGLVYYIKNDLAAELCRTGDGMYKDGGIVPFAHFAFNALMKVVHDFRDKSHLYHKICKKYLHNVFRAGASLPFYKFICTEESIVNETIQNQIGDSFIKGLIDKSSDISRELSFVSGGANAVDIAKQFAGDVAGALGANSDNKGALGTMAGALASGFKSMADFAVGGADAIFGKDLVDMVLKGNSLIYPRVWKGSSVETMASLQMRFYSPYGNFASIFQSVIVPLTILLGISLPRQVYPSFISYPFAFSIDVPGLFTTQMAIVTNISVKRGGRYDAWNNASMMRGVDITLDVTPLKPLMGFPEESAFNGVLDNEATSNSISGDFKRKGDITFSNYMRNLVGDFATSDTDFGGNFSANMASALKNQVAASVSAMTMGLPDAYHNCKSRAVDLLRESSTNNSKK